VDGSDEADLVPAVRQQQPVPEAIRALSTMTDPDYVKRRLLVRHRRTRHGVARRDRPLGRGALCRCPALVRLGSVRLHGVRRGAHAPVRLLGVRRPGAADTAPATPLDRLLACGGLLRIQAGPSFTAVT
jgi:hypothetical protein